MGEKGVGKSSLVAKFLDENVADQIEVTTALDFKYGTKMKEEKKIKVNVYELGGGRTLSHMLSTALNERSIASTTVCITIDLRISQR